MGVKKYLAKEKRMGKNFGNFVIKIAAKNGME